MIVLGGWLAEPAFDRQVALTMTSSTLHIAGRDTPPSDDERTTRNWGGGAPPFSPFFPGEPGGPWGPVAPAGPLGPAPPLSPLSPLSPLGPEHGQGQGQAAGEKEGVLHRKAASGLTRAINVLGRLNVPGNSGRSQR